MAIGKIHIKKGATFALGCTAKDGANPYNLTGWTVQCGLKHKDRFIGYLGVTPADLSLGGFRLSGNTVNWPVGIINADIKYTSPGGVVSYTETFDIVCEINITP